MYSTGIADHTSKLRLDLLLHQNTQGEKVSGKQKVHQINKNGTTKEL